MDYSLEHKMDYRIDWRSRMMKYESPELEVLNISEENVIFTSGEEGEGQGQDL